MTSARNQAIGERWLSGETLGAIGCDYGLTRWRIRQIVRWHCGIEETTRQRNRRLHPPPPPKPTKLDRFCARVEVQNSGC